MNRTEIVAQVQANISFFCERWDDFCRWVEKCADDLCRYRGSRIREKHDAIAEELRNINEAIRRERDEAHKKRPPVRRQEDIVTLPDGCTAIRQGLRPVEDSPEDREIIAKWTPALKEAQARLREADNTMLRLLDRLQSRGWVRWVNSHPMPLDNDWGDMYPAAGLRLPEDKRPDTLAGTGPSRRCINYWLDGPYAPPNVVNPVLWLFGRDNPRRPKPEERLLIACALLATAHDGTVPAYDRIYRRGSYKGERFDCDWACENLVYRLDGMERRGQVQQAWQIVEDYEQACQAAGESSEPFGFHGRAKNEQVFRYVFKNEGATWRIIYGEHETTVKDCKGVRYIHYLVRNKNQPIECLDIERVCAEKTPEGLVAAQTEDAQDAGLNLSTYDLKQLDDWDVKDIEKAIANLKAKLEDTDDPARKAELERQCFTLRGYLDKNLNIHGEGRPVGPREKSRDRVQKAINGAKNRIGKCNEQIGEHFRSAVKADGSAFIYKPDRELTWILG
jgi:hypothetical protein